MSARILLARRLTLLLASLVLMVVGT